MKSYYWTEEEDVFLKSLPSDLTRKEMFQKFKEAFPERTFHGFEARIRQLKIQYRKYTGGGERRFWKYEWDEWILANCEGVMRKDLWERFQNEFGVTCTLAAFTAHAKTIGALNGLKMQFKPGTGTVERETGRFLKGVEPANKAEVGTLRLRNAGTGTWLWYIKIGQPDEWVQYNRYLWEKEYGSRPEGYVFVDLREREESMDHPGTIDDIALMTRKAVAYMNRNGLRAKSRDEAQVIEALADISTRLKQLRK